MWLFTAKKYWKHLKKCISKLESAPNIFLNWRVYDYVNELAPAHEINKRPRPSWWKLTLCYEMCSINENAYASEVLFIVVSYKRAMTTKRSDGCLSLPSKNDPCVAQCVCNIKNRVSEIWSGNKNVILYTWSNPAWWTYTETIFAILIWLYFF